jgi:diguanylate cyclase (GGDEF)-like protein
MAVKAEDMAARLLAEFRHALENGQLVAYFQPEVELSSGRVVAAESLARWEHPDLGTLPPSLFAPLAEQLGLMGELTRLMLRSSLTQQRSWAASGCDIPVSVNVGPDCVADPEFPAVIAGFLRSERVPGRMLTLEVSEQTGTSAVSAGFFAQLAEFGVRVALDDFGTGYASLESLGGWPIDELKLDMSLVRPIANNASFRTIVRTTIDLAHQLGVKVVAEGIESEAVRFELAALGCDIGQGFLFGRAMPAEVFAGWLRDQDQLAPRRAGAGHQIAASAVEAAVAAADRLQAGGKVSRRLARTGRSLTDLVGGTTMAIAATLLVAYGLWQVFRWGGHRHQALIGDLAFFPVNGAAALCAGRVGFRKDLGSATCRAWRLLSAALWLFLLGDAIQLYYEVVLHKRAYPTWADAAYLSFYVVAFGGILSFPVRRRTLSERFRLVLDMGTVFVGGGTLIWYLALGPAVAGSDHRFDLSDLVTFAYPVGDLLLLFGLLSLLWRGAPRLSVASLRIFATGLLVFIAADVSYDYITVHSSYLGGDPVDTLWILALTVLFAAASVQLRAKPGAEAARSAWTGRPSRPSTLPYLAVAGSYLLLMAVGLHESTFNPLGGILLGALVLTVLVTVRQFAALRDNGRLAARYQELASIDAMTGLYNRRHFMELAEGAFAHALRVGQPLVALMIDVDHFKEINDVHGHALGDQVLADLAQSCREQVRADDIAGRYGGDEYIIIIPGTTSVRAVQVAAQLTGPPARVTGSDGNPVSFTVSIGIAESAGCADLPALLARADLAMYEAKRAGGGCWRAFEGTGQVADAVPTA